MNDVAITMCTLQEFGSVLKSAREVSSDPVQVSGISGAEPRCGMGQGVSSTGKLQNSKLQFICCCPAGGHLCIVACRFWASCYGDGQCQSPGWGKELDSGAGGITHFLMGRTSCSHCLYHFILGVENWQNLSHRSLTRGEWFLHPDMFHQICLRWDTPDMIIWRPVSTGLCQDLWQELGILWQVGCRLWWWHY